MRKQVFSICHFKDCIFFTQYRYDFSFQEKDERKEKAPLYPHSHFTNSKRENFLIICIEQLAVA